MGIRFYKIVHISCDINGFPYIVPLLNAPKMLVNPSNTLMLDISSSTEGILFKIFAKI